MKPAQDVAAVGCLQRVVMSLAAGVNMLRLPSLLASYQALCFPEPLFIPNQLCNDPVLCPPPPHERRNIKRSVQEEATFVRQLLVAEERAYFSSCAEADDKFTCHIKRVFFGAACHD